MPGDKGELELTVHHRSDKGRVRDHNEDYLGYRQPKDSEMRAEAGWLYAVADGVGGAQAGEVASKLAVQTLLTTYYRAYQETLAERLLAAFAEANHAVYSWAEGQEGPHRMSTTLVAAAFRGRELTVANVGDSRAYLIHRGQIRQITHDHSMVARLMDEGVITPEQAESHPRRHVISRSIGARPHVEADLFTETIHPGDRLLLCTDGLTECVADAEILTTVQAKDPEACVLRLVELANERGGKDNITVLLVRALGEREERLPPLPLPQKADEGPVLSPWSSGPRTEGLAEGPLPRRSYRLWMGAILLCLLICAAGLAAGTFLLRPTPTPTTTATTTPLPPFADATASATAALTPTSLPTATDAVPPTETPTLVSIEPPTASDTPSPTGTPSPSRTPTNTPSPTHTRTASPAPTQTSLTPTDTAWPRFTETATLTPTATSTSEISVLPTPTDTLTPTPTPTGTTESSPLPTRRP